MYGWFIALRYLSSRFIAFAALLIVASAVALLIVILSVMEGFRMDLQDRIRGTSADLRVESRTYIGLRDPAAAAEKVSRVGGVRALSTYVETLAMHQRGPDALAGYFTLQAVDLAQEARVGGMATYLETVRKRASRAAARDRGSPRGFREPERLEDALAAQPTSPEGILSEEWLGVRLWETSGERKPSPDEGGLPARPILVGYEAMTANGFWPGQVLRLTSFSPVTNRTREGRFFVAGAFQSRDYQYDRYTLVLPRLEDAAAFLDLRDPATGIAAATGIRVAAAEGEDLDALSGRVREAVQDVPFVRIRTWREEKASLLRAVKIEKTVVGIILSVVILFAGFMIFIVLTVQVVEKTRDLGILQSLGSTPQGIAGIYFRIAGCVCISGTVLGSVLGVAFSLSVNTIQRWIYVLTGFEVFPHTVYYIDRIPVCLAPRDLIIIIGPTVLVSLILSIVPAFRAARKDPVVALRYE